MQPLLPFDLVGCTVEEVEWPARGFRMILGGKTAKGESVAGCRLTFEAVANVEAARDVPVRETSPRHQSELSFAGNPSRTATTGATSTHSNCPRS